MLNIESEILDKLVAILRSAHPWEIIGLWEELESSVSRDGAAYIGRETRNIERHWQYLVDDMKEYEE